MTTKNATTITKIVNTKKEYTTFNKLPIGGFYKRNPSHNLPLPLVYTKVKERTQVCLNTGKLKRVRHPDAKIQQVTDFKIHSN